MTERVIGRQQWKSEAGEGASVSAGTVVAPAPGHTTTDSTLSLTWYWSILEQCLHARNSGSGPRPVSPVSTQHYHLLVWCLWVLSPTVSKHHHIHSHWNCTLTPHDKIEMLKSAWNWLNLILKCNKKICICLNVDHSWIKWIIIRCVWTRSFWKMVASDCIAINWNIFICCWWLSTPFISAAILISVCLAW